MNLKDYADDVIAIAKHLAPLVGPGATSAVAAAEAVLAAGERLKPSLGATDQAALTAELDALAEKVLAHADQTAANLRT